MNTQAERRQRGRAAGDEQEAGHCPVSALPPAVLDAILWPNMVMDLRAQFDAELQLPTNVSAEQALLGSLLCDNRGFAVVAEIVRPEDFAWGLHGRIFNAIGQLISQGTGASPVTLQHYFARDPARPGQKYLMELARRAITLHNNVDYALIIADLAIRRELISRLQEPTPGESALDLLSDLNPRLQALREAKTRMRTSK